MDASVFPDSFDAADSAPLSDDELTALALAADPSAPLPLDAVPFEPAHYEPENLPAWYMPGAIRRSTPSWWRSVAVVLVLGFLLIEAAGLCSAYGSLVVP